MSRFWFGVGVLPLIGHFEPIHLLSLWGLVALAIALAAILKGRAASQLDGWRLSGASWCFCWFPGTGTLDRCSVGHVVMVKSKRDS